MKAGWTIRYGWPTGDSSYAKFGVIVSIMGGVFFGFRGFGLLQKLPSE